MAAWRSWNLHLVFGRWWSLLYQVFRKSGGTWSWVRSCWMNSRPDDQLLIDPCGDNWKMIVVLMWSGKFSLFDIGWKFVVVVLEVDGLWWSNKCSVKAALELKKRVGAVGQVPWQHWNILNLLHIVRLASIDVVGCEDGQLRWDSKSCILWYLWLHLGTMHGNVGSRRVLLLSLFVL